MLTLELYISECCPSCSDAIVLAKKAIKVVSGVILIIRRSDQADQGRARSAGIIISPTFVLEGKVCAVGVPKLEHLIQQLREAPR